MTKDEREEALKAFIAAYAPIHARWRGAKGYASPPVQTEMSLEPEEEELGLEDVWALELEGKVRRERAKKPSSGESPE